MQKLVCYETNNQEVAGVIPALAAPSMNNYITYSTWMRRIANRKGYV